jgi:hypothetical protein
MMYSTRRWNSPNPVTQGVLLQEFFGEILEIALRERDAGNHCNFGVA